MGQAILLSVVFGFCHFVWANGESPGTPEVCGRQLGNAIQTREDIVGASTHLISHIQGIDKKLALRFENTIARQDDNLPKASGQSPGLSAELNREVLDLYTRFNDIAAILEPQSHASVAQVGLRAALRAGLEKFGHRVPRGLNLHVARFAEESPRFREVAASLENAIDRALERNGVAQLELEATEEEYRASLADRLDLIEILRNLEQQRTSIAMTLQEEFTDELILPLVHQVDILDRRLESIHTFIRLHKVRIETVERSLRNVQSETRIHFGTILASAQMIETNDQMGRLTAATRSMKTIAQRTFNAAVDSTNQLVRDTDQQQALTNEDRDAQALANRKLDEALSASTAANRAYREGLKKKMAEFDKRSLIHEQRSPALPPKSP